LNSDVFGEVDTKDDIEKMLGKVSEESGNADSLLVLATGFFLMFIFRPVIFLVDSFILMVMWNWFMVAVGFMSISFPLSLGLYLLVGFLFYKGEFYKATAPSVDKEGTEVKEWTKSPVKTAARIVRNRIIVWSASLTLAWLIHFFV
jgi:hypothetical protein